MLEKKKKKKILVWSYVGHLKLLTQADKNSWKVNITAEPLAHGSLLILHGMSCDLYQFLSLKYDILAKQLQISFLDHISSHLLVSFHLVTFYVKILA